MKIIISYIYIGGEDLQPEQEYVIARNFSGPTDDFFPNNQLTKICIFLLINTNISEFQTICQQITKDLYISKY